MWPTLAAILQTATALPSMIPNDSTSSSGSTMSVLGRLARSVCLQVHQFTNLSYLHSFLWDIFLSACKKVFFLSHLFDFFLLFCCVVLRFYILMPISSGASTPSVSGSSRYASFGLDVYLHHSRDYLYTEQFDDMTLNCVPEKVRIPVMVLFATQRLLHGYAPGLIMVNAVCSPGATTFGILALFSCISNNSTDMHWGCLQFLISTSHYRAWVSQCWSVLHLLG